MSNTGKKYKSARENIDRERNYPLDEAVKLVKRSSFANFDETVDAAFNLGVDPRHADQMVRGTIVLPNGTGKETVVLAIATGEKAKEAKEAGADYTGKDEFFEKIEDGWLEFDAVVATPDTMSDLGKLGRILGPRGLMPSPKTGTVTFDIGEAVEDLKAGKVEYKADKEGILQVPVGKVSFSEEDLKENIEALVEAVKRDRPAAAKGVYIRSLNISSTMGPGVKVETDGLGTE